MVVLGATGRNLGAGMSGGVAYVLDMHNTLTANVNQEMVGVTTVEEPDDVNTLHALIMRHGELTRSSRAEEILDNWAIYGPRFKKVSPLAHIAPPPPRDIERARRDALLAANQNRSRSDQ